MALIAVGAGAVLALGQAPFHLFPLMFIPFVVLVYLLDGAVSGLGATGVRRYGSAFLRGWLFGFGYFVAGLWWMGSAFLVNAERFALLLPLGVIALPAVLAIFFGVGCAIAKIFWSSDYRRVIALAFALTLIEWLRSFILTGFPWNSIGYILAANDTLLQGLSIFGGPLYTFFAVLIFSSVAVLADSAGVTSKAGGNQPLKGSHRFLAIVAILALALPAFGVLRLANAPAIDEKVDGVQLRVVQPNIAQKDKFKRELAGDILERHVSLSQRSTRPGDLGLLSTTHLIWPESAFPFLLTNHPQVLSHLADMLPPGTTLITGAVRADPEISGQTERRFYNSVYTIDHTGAITDAYDKVHLVPFGEYLPFQSFLESLGLLAFIEVPGGFTPGPANRLMQVTSAPAFLPLICYEVIFPHDLDENEEIASAGWILNVTNDAWFGPTTGPYQHFHQTRIRAVEEGLPVVRAANNGISAVIDAYGRVVDSVGLGKPGIIDSSLPVPAEILVTDNMKDIFLAIVMLCSFVLIWRRR